MVDYNIVCGGESLTVLTTIGAVILGALLTFFVQLFIEKRKENKVYDEKIFIPLYEELERISLNISEYSQSALYQFQESEWSRIKREHLVIRIQPKEFRDRIAYFYEIRLHNFRVSKTAMINTIKTKIAEKLQFDKNTIDNIDKELTPIALFLVRHSTIETIDQAKISFNKIREQNNIPYAMVDELEKDIKPIISKMEIYQSTMKEERILYFEIQKIRAILSRKINRIFL